jgi:hypothetical protein
MATSIAFGLAFSAVLVLFFVPALLSLLESLQGWLRSMQSQSGASSTSTPPM